MQKDDIGFPSCGRHRDLDLIAHEIPNRNGGLTLTLLIPLAACLFLAPCLTGPPPHVTPAQIAAPRNIHSRQNTFRVSSRKTDRTQKHCCILARSKRVDASFSALGQGHSPVRTTTIPACDESNLRLCFEVSGRSVSPIQDAPTYLVTGRDEYATAEDCGYRCYGPG